MSLVTCQRCGKTFEVSKATGIKYCSDCRAEIKKELRLKEHEKRFQKKQERLLKGVEGVDYVIDRWNGYATKTISSSWMRHQHPGKTLEDYIREFPDAPLICESTSKILSEHSKAFMNSPEAKKYFSEIMSGDRNPNSKCNTTEEHRKSISPFSKSFKGYAGMTDDEKSKIIKERLGTDRDDRSTNQVGYWLKLGYSEEEAKHLVSERQRTFTLEKCIEKYGEEVGLDVWRERQLKWQKSYQHLNYSKVSQELFWSIYKELNDVCYFAQNDNGVLDDSGRNHEMKVKTSNSAVSLDFYYPKTNSIIEFDGDYWHSETREYVNKHRDIDRDNSLKEMGYDRILHIKESDYRKDKDATIRKCIEFLKI